MLDGDRQDFITIGVAISILAHVVIGFFTLVVALPQMEPFPKAIVYSVTMESGKSLGGITKVEKEEKFVPAPEKRLSGDVPEVQPEKEKKPEEKPLPPEEPEEDAEVSIATPKPTAVATPVPTKDPAPTPKPTAKPEKKEAPAKPTALPTAKSAPTKKPKNTVDDVDKRLQQGLNKWLDQSTDTGGPKKKGSGDIGPGDGPGGPNVRPPEFFAYQKLIQRRVKDAWRWYDTSTSLITQVTFKIDPTGKVDQVYVAKSSGNTEYDESVVRAVYKASPLPPPPESVYEFFKHVRITFDPRDF